MVNMDKFKKLMMVTTSPLDGEALNALRMANKMLVQENLTWSMFFDNISKKSSGSIFEDILRDMAKHERAQENSRPRSAPPRHVRKERPVREAKPFKKKVFKIRRDD